MKVEYICIRTLYVMKDLIGLKRPFYHFIGHTPS